MSNKILIVGSGISGAVLARELVEKNSDLIIEIWESREHIGGNCYTYEDKDTNITIHKYGPHIFNTNETEIWNYINQYGNFINYTNRVKAVTDKGIFSLPINLLTINQFFNKKFNPNDAKEFLNSIKINYLSTNNFEEEALSKIGRDLYNNFIRGYTLKQWGCDPRYLPSSIFNRLPIRFNYDDNFYEKKYVGIPEHGYTKIFENILNHQRIQVILNKNFNLNNNLSHFKHIFYSGSIDRLFNSKFGDLGYRTVHFEQIDTKDIEDYQGNAVINYTSENVNFTRIHEHKHFTPWKKFSKTVVFKEFSIETDKNDIPYYPKRLKSDLIILEKYKNYITENMKNISFIGRLGTYRYLDMEKVISESLTISNIVTHNIKNNKLIPPFFNF